MAGIDLHAAAPSAARYPNIEGSLGVSVISSPTRHNGVGEGVLGSTGAQAAELYEREIPPDAAFAHGRAKRALDLVVATAALAVTAPLWVAASVAIRATSPGPVIFRQKRVGLGGRRFTVLKFRTMVHGADDAQHRQYVASMILTPMSAAPIAGVYKLAHDDRITPVGHWLRRTSFDELPQFINVLRGEMSIVGPRPALPYEVELYEPWQLERLTARPGITGAWQVGGRNRLGYLDMCRLDVGYIRGWTLRRDVSIVLRTPMAMARVRATA